MTTATDRRPTRCAAPASIDYLVIVSPVYGTSAVAEEAVTYYGDLRTGAIDTSLPEDVQTEPPAKPA